jgi:hypothetical protein
MKSRVSLPTNDWTRHGGLYRLSSSNGPGDQGRASQEIGLLKPAHDPQSSYEGAKRGHLA